MPTTAFSTAMRSFSSAEGANEGALATSEVSAPHYLSGPAQPANNAIVINQMSPENFRRLAFAHDPKQAKLLVAMLISAGPRGARP
jgi:hypothetical protein